MLLQAIELNTQAVCTLANGKSGRATVDALKQAMEIMEALYEDRTIMDCSKATEDGRLQCRAVSMPDLYDEHFFIFNHALLFDPVVVSTSPSGIVGPSDMAYGCAVLTFNMALAYHQIGIQTGSSKKLKTSCLLYGKVAEMTSAAVASRSDLSVLHLIALNNAAQIQYSQARFVACDELFSHVRYILQFPDLLESSTDQLVQSVLASGDIDEIKLNTVVCNTPSTAPTA